MAKERQHPHVIEYLVKVHEKKDRKAGKGKERARPAAVTHRRPAKLETPMGGVLLTNNADDEDDEEDDEDLYDHGDL